MYYSSVFKIAVMTFFASCLILSFQIASPANQQVLAQSQSGLKVNVHLNGLQGKQLVCIFSSTQQELSCRNVIVPSTVQFPLAQNLIKDRQKFTVCAQGALQPQPICVGGVNNPGRSPENVYLTISDPRAISPNTNNATSSQAGAAIKAKYDEAIRVGFQGKPTTTVRATDDKSGFYQYYKDPKGKEDIWAIYWTQETGARLIYGKILQKWSQLGWQKSTLGYPTTDELPIPNSKSGGRYNEFENGYIVWTPQAGAVVTTTLAEPSQSPSPSPAPPPQQALKKFKVTFAGIEPFRCHDEDCEDADPTDDDCAKWDMIGSASGKVAALMGSTCVPSYGKWALDKSNANYGGENLLPIFHNVPEGLGPYAMVVTIPSDGSFLIEASGRERDATTDGDPANLYVQLAEDANKKIKQYISEKYKLNGTELGYAKEIGDYLKKSSSPVAQVAGQTGQTAAELSAVFGSQTVPGWGQAALAAYSVYKFINFLTDVNPDDGIGVIKEVCSSENNFCIGEHAFRSKFNGKDQDSTGDYNMLVRVEEVK